MTDNLMPQEAYEAMDPDQKMRRLYNRFFRIDPGLWVELRRLEPKDVERRTLTSFDAHEQSYNVRFLSRTYQVNPFQESIRLGRKIFAPDEAFQLQLVLLTYLTQASEEPLSGEMVSEKQLKSGTVFFQGPHVLNKEPILKRFGRDPEGFRELGGRYHGEFMRYGDVSFVVTALPKVPLGFILHYENDEFPARLVITFDRSIESHFKLDVAWALVNVAVAQFTEDPD